MSEMIERVAKAIGVAQWGASNATGDAWRELPDIMPAARAAVAALREPTSEMVRFGETAASQAIGPQLSQAEGRKFADAAFRAMIERALAE